ncbi:hypothetical protein EGW08_021460, partial [Elysia chlorotica]
MLGETNLLHPCQMSFSFIFTIIILFLVSTEAEDVLVRSLPDLDLEQDVTPPESYYRPCEAFFHEYVAAAGNFTHCDLLHAKPFRMCTRCFQPYAIMKSLYQDLTTDPKLHDCMIKYLKSDRVQIIPSVQKTADSLWRTSACDSCIKDLNVDEKTKEVEYTVPSQVHKFLTLYSNISHCLMGNLSLDINPGTWMQDKVQNISALCKVCDDNYHRLNEHYNSMSNSANGDVCMDVVDMMNYTRFTWSVDLNCSHRSGEAASVLIIALAVAVSPLFFYLPLRYTSKE